MVNKEKAPIVLLPGLQSGPKSWHFQLQYFEGKREMLVPTGYHGQESIVEMAKEIEPQLPPRFHLVAWSMGGYITFQMLPEIAQRLCTLILIATSASAEDPGLTRRRRALIRIGEHKGMKTAVRQSFAQSHYRVDTIPDSVKEAVIQANAGMGLDLFRTQQHAIITRADSTDKLPLIKCPTLIIVGEKDQVTPPDRSREMHAAITQSKFIELKECGHGPPLEYPDRINALIESWVSA